MIKNLFLNNRLFYALFGVGILYILGFFFPAFVKAAHLFLSIILILFVVDFLLLFNVKKGLEAVRTTPEKLSNGDENKIDLEITNEYPFPVSVKIIDEIPFQFQIRDFLIRKEINKKSKIVTNYILNPKQRGDYLFGALNIYAQTKLGFASRRYTFQKNQTLACYPSFIHLRQYEMMALQNEILMGGLKKIRKSGHTTEFEQIKEYVAGDDVRTINWKASGKRNQLMINQYQEERSQRIDMLLDKGRSMQMPFDGLTLLDYSINATLALSHIILKKSDRAGLMTFSKKTENRIPADQKSGQLRRISEALFNINTNFYESDFSRLYQDLKFSITQRSLLLMFSNFETLDALSRQMKYLRGIAKNHVLVIIFFKNAELQQIIHKKPENTQEIYDEIIAEKFEFEKQLIIQELRKYGIHSIYTAPENLTIDVINKYLEIKARGIL